MRPSSETRARRVMDMVDSSREKILTQSAVGSRQSLSGGRSPSPSRQTPTGRWPRATDCDRLRLRLRLRLRPPTATADYRLPTTHCQQTVPEGTAQAEPAARGQVHGEVSVLLRGDLGDAVEVDDRRPVDADEAGRVQFGFELHHGLAHHEGRRPRVQLDVVAVSLERIDLVRRHDDVALTVADDEP